VRALGFDTGSRNIGWAVVEYASGREHLVSSGVYDPGAKLGRAQYELAQYTMALLQAHHPDVVGYERVFFPARAAGQATVHNMSTGAILGVCGFLPVYGVAPRDLKTKIAGDSKAGKDQVALMVAYRLGITARGEAEQWIRAREDHETDACAVALVTLDLWRRDKRAERWGRCSS